MKKKRITFKKVLLILLIVFVLIQFIRPAKNQSSQAMPDAIENVYPTSDSVKAILKVACYDCHSNNTRYPWYNNIQPVAWWLDSHVREGKDELNFDEFGKYRIRKRYFKMDETIKLVKESKMPLRSYTWIHKDAILSTDQKAAVTQWAQGIMHQIEATTPADSLKRKQQ